MNWETLNWSASVWDFVFGLITFISFILFLREKKAKELANEKYRAHCEQRCKRIVHLIRDLSDHSRRSCELTNSIISAKNDNNSQSDKSYLVGHSFSIRTITNTLIDLCRELNEEFENDFKQKIYEDFEKELPEKYCPETGDQINYFNKNAKS